MYFEIIFAKNTQLRTFLSDHCDLFSDYINKLKSHLMTQRDRTRLSHVLFTSLIIIPFYIYNYIPICIIKFTYIIIYSAELSSINIYIFFFPFNHNATMIEY